MEPLKQWHRYLIEALTAAVFKREEWSRHQVRKWQKGMFGRSICAEDMKHCAVAERAGGGRAAALEMDPEIEQRVQEIYARYKNALPAALQRAVEMNNPKADFDLTVEGLAP